MEPTMDDYIRNALLRKMYLFFMNSSDFVFHHNNVHSYFKISASIVCRRSTTCYRRFILDEFSSFMNKRHRNWNFELDSRIYDYCMRLIFSIRFLWSSNCFFFSNLRFFNGRANWRMNKNNNKILLVQNINGVFVFKLQINLDYSYLPMENKIFIFILLCS